MSAEAKAKDAFEGFDFDIKYDETSYIKPHINVGALYDIPTGEYTFGQYGESILNGGVGTLTGVVGIGNNFKSTIMRYLQLTAASRFEFTKIHSYDTEMNIQRPRLLRLAVRAGGSKFKSIFTSGTWKITDRTIYFANTWYERYKEFMGTKESLKKKFIRNTPFLGPDGVSFIQWLMPTFADIDSFTEFETEDVGKIQDENELGESGGNTMHMRQGLGKIRFLSDVLKRATSCGTSVFLTAHIGKEIPMDVRAAPVKKLQFLKNGDKVKGVTDKFFFLTGLAIQCQNAAPLSNRDTKAAEYPLDSLDNDNAGDTDLNIVTTIILRNKSGPTGHVIPLLVSQRDGVLPTLSEFHYCKTDDRFGMESNTQNFAMHIYPDVKLSRKTVRQKINEDKRLRTAIRTTADLCQMKHYWRFENPEDLVTPKKLREDLVALGYDWDVLLDTRSWWTFNNTDPNLKPFLTTMDLLRMRKGLYHPYWLAQDKKTIVDINTDKAHREWIMGMVKKIKHVSFVEPEIEEDDLVEV